MTIDFEALAEASPYSIIVTDDVLLAPGPRIVYVNPAFERMTGWPCAEILGRSPRVLQGPRTDKGIFAALPAILREGGTWRGETWNYRRDGSEFLMEWIITPLRDRRSGETLYFSIQRDVTARAAMHRRLNHALAAAAAADRAKLDFLAVVGHELRTPLNAVIGFAELIERQAMGPVAPTYVDYAGMIRAGGAALLGLVENVLDFTDGGSGAALLEEAEVSLPALARDVLEAMRAPAAAAGVAIAVDAPAPLAVRGDARRLRQALTQIVGNAIKFNRTGGRVDIAVGLVDGAPAITVEDDGPGFPASGLDGLLAPCTQSDMSLARPHEGLGLGLALARRHLALHGGELRLGHAPQRGARVAVLLPAGRLAGRSSAVG